MKKNKKGFVIAGLLVFVVMLTAGLFMLGSVNKREDVPQSTDTLAKDVTPSKIPDVPPATDDNDIELIGTEENDPIIHDPAPIDDVVDIPLTSIEPKPEPPSDKPDTAAGQDLTNPDKPPETVEVPPVTNPPATTNPPPAATNPPSATNPNAGDKQDGKVYIPGFGWVEDQGGGGQGSDSYVDESKLDNIIGH